MVFAQNDLVIKMIDDLPIMAWVRDLSTKPGEVSVLLLAPPCSAFPEGFTFTSDLDTLEKVNAPSNSVQGDYP